MGHRILCFGDSNTYGYDPRSYLGGRYPASVRWTGRLRAQGWEILNEGQNGRTIPRKDRALSPQADALAVMLGTNDLLQGATAGQCAERMESFLTPLRGGVPLLLIAPPPLKPGDWVRDPRLIQESRRLPDCYRALAAALGIHFASAADWGVPLAFDGVHFSEEGHQVFARHMAGVLAGLFP